MRRLPLITRSAFSAFFRHALHSLLLFDTELRFFCVNKLLQAIADCVQVVSLDEKFVHCYPHQCITGMSGIPSF